MYIRVRVSVLRTAFCVKQIKKLKCQVKSGNVKTLSSSDAFLPFASQRRHARCRQAESRRREDSRAERVQHCRYLYLYLLTIWIICICICYMADREPQVAMADREPRTAMAYREPPVAMVDREPRMAMAYREPPVAMADREPRTAKAYFSQVARAGQGALWPWS